MPLPFCTHLDVEDVAGFNLSPVGTQWHTDWLLGREVGPCGESQSSDCPEGCTCSNLKQPHRRLARNQPVQELGGTSPGLQAGDHLRPT
jgi:hypothetical protein